MDEFWQSYDRIVYCSYNKQYRSQREFHMKLMNNRKTILVANIVGMTLLAARDKVVSLTIRP